MGILSSYLGNAANAIKGAASASVVSAVSQAASGDVYGALASLGSAVENAVDTVGAYGAATPGDGMRGMNARSDGIQNWCWYCLMPTLTNPNSLSIMNTQGSVSLPWYYVQRGTIPFRVLETESIKRNSQQIHLPTGYSVPNLSLEFYMDSANKAQEYLKAWSSLVLGTSPVANVVNRGVWGLPATYKKNITFYVLSVTKKQLLTIKYVGCWPADPQALELTSSDPAILAQTVSFMVEDVEVTVSNDKGLVDKLSETAIGYGVSALKSLLPF